MNIAAIFIFGTVLYFSFALFVARALSGKWYPELKDGE